MTWRRLVVAAVSTLVVASLLAGGLLAWGPWVTAAPAAGTSFSDVPDAHPNAVAIADLSGRGIIGGFADGTFKPDSPITRQQFAKMIVKTLGLAVPADAVCPFTDVDPTPNPTDPNYPAKYVAVCAQKGITTGKTATTFDPGASITRQQLVTMVVRAIDLPQPPAGYSPPFTPTQFTLDEHFANARAAAYVGLLGDLGVNATYSFSAAATRADCAQVLHNLLFRRGQGQAVDLIHFWWDFGANWQNMRAENLSTVVGSASGSAKVLGEPYYYNDSPNFPADYTFAVGENGDLLVFSSYSGSDWSVEHVPAPGGSRLSAMLGGRAFDDVTAVTISNSVKTLHVFATDADDNLIHFWLSQSGGSWRGENVSAQVGRKMHLMGSPCTWEDYSVVQVVGTAANGDLLHFWLKDGGSWRAEDVSALVGRTIKGEASFNWDANGSLGTAVVAAGPNNELLIFHHKGAGQWSVEDVTAATASATPGGVTLGGWLSWWDWGDDEWGSQFHDPVAVLDTKGHFWLLERTGAGGWTTKDVSADIGQTFKAETGGDSILVFWNPPNLPAREAHFAGVNEDNDFIHFWRDTAGKWHSEDMTAKSGQKVRYPVNQFADEGSGPSGQSGWCDYIAAVAPNGDLVFIWDNVLFRDWKTFDATTLTGYKVRPPELPWWAGHVNMVLEGAQ